MQEHQHLMAHRMKDHKLAKDQLLMATSSTEVTRVPRKAHRRTGTASLRRKKKGRKRRCSTWIRLPQLQQLMMMPQQLMRTAQTDQAIIMKEDLLWRRGVMQAFGVFWRLVVMVAIRKH